MDKENKIACKKEQVKLLRGLIEKNTKYVEKPVISLMLILTLIYFFTTGYETELSLILFSICFLNIGNVISCFIMSNKADKLEIEIKDSKYNS